MNQNDQRSGLQRGITLLSRLSYFPMISQSEGGTRTHNPCITMYSEKSVGHCLVVFGKTRRGGLLDLLLRLATPPQSTTSLES